MMLSPTLEDTVNIINESTALRCNWGEEKKIEIVLSAAVTECSHFFRMIKHFQKYLQWKGPFPSY